MHSSIPRPARRTPAMGRGQMVVGIPTILIGFGCYALSTVFENGFLHGFFQGATIALMVLGAYLLGARLWSSRKDEKDLRAGKQWLPSRDGRGDETH